MRCDWGSSLGLNVAGGLLAVWVGIGSRTLFAMLHRRRFRKVFGTGESYRLVFGSLSLHPRVLQAVTDPQLKQYPLAKRSDPVRVFSAESTASASEIRAAAYIATVLAIDGKRNSIFEADESLKEKLDLDFVSFGAYSNLKTVDAFANESNDLLEWSETLRCFTSRDGQPLYQTRDGYDYGIILRIHPIQFPQRTWIVCAGLGEWEHPVQPGSWLRNGMKLRKGFSPRQNGLFVRLR